MLVVFLWSFVIFVEQCHITVVNPANYNVTAGSVLSETLKWSIFRSGREYHSVGLNVTSKPSWIIRGDLTLTELDSDASGVGKDAFPLDTDGTYAYVCYGDSWVIYDVSNKSDIQKLKTVTEDCHDIVQYTSGGISLVLVGTDTHVRRYNVSDKTNPVYVDSFAPSGGGTFSGISVHRTWGKITVSYDSGSGKGVYTAASFPSFWQRTYDSTRHACSDKYAWKFYHITSNEVRYKYEGSGPSVSTEAKRIQCQSGGKLLYVPDGANGVRLYSGCGTPVLLTTFFYPAYHALGVAVNERKINGSGDVEYIFVAYKDGTSGGVIIFAHWKVGHLFEVVRDWSTTNEVHGIKVWRNYVFVTEKNYGLRVFEFGDIELTGNIPSACPTEYELTVTGTDSLSYASDTVTIYASCPNTTNTTTPPPPLPPPCDTNCTDWNCNLTSSNGRCVGPNSSYCTCKSGYYGELCQHEQTSCFDWKTVHPLNTEFVPEFLDTSRIQNNHIELYFKSPIVYERYDYRILIGGKKDNVCDSWVGPGWIMSMNGCNVSNEAVLDWDTVEEECGWEKNDTGSQYVYTTKINFQVMEDHGLKQRFIEWDYDVIVRIPKTVAVATIMIAVYAPDDVSLQAILFEQNVFPSTMTGIFKLYTRLNYPYILTNESVHTEPPGTYSVFDLETQACHAGSGNCDQEWDNDFTYDAIVGGETKCDVSGSYYYRFLLNCRDGHGYDYCPYEDEEVIVKTEILSDSFCEPVQIEPDISAVMKSYEDSNFTIQENGFLYDETAYFNITLTSHELSLAQSKVIQVSLEYEDSGTQYIHLYLNEQKTGAGIACSFNTTAGYEPKFWFILKASYIPARVYTVHATVEVQYLYETMRRTIHTKYHTYRLTTQTCSSVQNHHEKTEDPPEDDDEDGVAGKVVNLVLLLLVLYIFAFVF